MSAAIIDGKAFADGLRARLADHVADFAAKAGRKPGLAVVLVGEDPASAVYVRSKGKATEAAGKEAEKKRRDLDTEILAKLGNATSGRLADGRIVSAKTIRRAGYSVQPSSYRPVKIKGEAA